MTTGTGRADINAKQIALAKMGGSKRQRLSKRSGKRSGKRSSKQSAYKRRTYRRLCTCKKSCNKRGSKRKRQCNCNKCHSKKHHSRKIRGGAVAPTTSGGSQGGSDKVFMAQQQAVANRQFDTPNKT